MAQSVTNLAEVAMRIYDKNVHEQVFTKNVLYNNILKNVATRSQGSTTKYMKVHYARNIGAAAGGETIVLPTAGQQGYKESTIPMKYEIMLPLYINIV